MITESNLSEQEKPTALPSEQETPTAPVETSNQLMDDDSNEEEHDDASEQLTLEQLLDEMEKRLNQNNAGEYHREFNRLKQLAASKIGEETEDRKHDFIEEGGNAEDFRWEHPFAARLSGLASIFKEKYDLFQKAQEEQHRANAEERRQIIEKLKNLYSNTEAGTNLFKSIRTIKEEWAQAGQVAKTDFKLLNNDYYHHLNQFYAMLELNKDYLHQEYEHNLEKRKQIIQHAKTLLEEPIQKALNELQYLHKLWKEEAEPVAEEFRENTWEEFKAISNQIHERKAELSAAIEKEQNENLEAKNAIINEIKKLTQATKEHNHNFWQKAIRQVEELRNNFLKTGRVPRKLSNQNWQDFKQTLRQFNSTKNDFYKNLKGSQIENLEAKQKLIQIAKDNMASEDWETMVPLFKKLQEDWKNIGHVPRSQANKVWEEFREACNTFFDNYRSKNAESGDNWKENYAKKKALLDQLKEIGTEEGSIEKIEEIKTEWNAIGKVPRNKIAINSEFNKTLREKLKLNKISEFDLKDENLSETQLADKARKLKNQISDLENEVSTLENNLNFFNIPSRENPLLQETFKKIDEKRAQLETLRISLHQLISGH
ncbi:DUF349 domain-containing protein [Bergeyella sp. RCAD1439]|uniref:DUF349 domain-containing protein n=1 Tax=Bergeyella anatis TaxID=3113737 RepID=UPI002E16FD48|nr:DUF349 domain-containing protein [Bergeyella sp. RCAD1439]